MRGSVTIDSPSAPHPPRFARRPLPCGEREERSPPNGSLHGHARDRSPPRHHPGRGRRAACAARAASSTTTARRATRSVSSCARRTRIARIRSIDTSEARSAEGVLAVLTAADIKAAGVGNVSAHPPLPGRGGAKLIMPFRPSLADERVMHVGQPVALVVAETPAAAQDAAEKIAVDYEELEPVVAAARSARARRDRSCGPRRPATSRSTGSGSPRSRRPTRARSTRSSSRPRTWRG